MRKFTQRELISEGFWNNFKGAVKGTATLGKEIAKVVAPEITDPLEKLGAWKDRTYGKVEAAANPEKAVKNFLIDNGYYPYEEIVPHKRGKLESSNKGKGGQNYITKVVELEYDKQGKAKKSPHKYSNPVAIVAMDKDYNMSFLKRPRRDFAKSSQTPTQSP